MGDKGGDLGFADVTDFGYFVVNLLGSSGSKLPEFIGLGGQGGQEGVVKDGVFRSSLVEALANLVGELVRNCWARELGHLAILAAEEESRVGMRERKNCSISVGVWDDFLWVAGSTRQEVRVLRV